MRTICYCTSFWNSQAEAEAKAKGKFGLIEWRVRALHYFNPIHLFVTCGTYSDPNFSLLPMRVPIVNAGVPLTKPYETRWWNYSGCALTAACCYALNRDDWDLLVLLDTDVLIGAVDFNKLLGEFMDRSELLLDADWYGRPTGLFILKREGAVRYAYNRLRPNLIENTGQPEPMLLEDEIGEIFKGAWHNPWPDIKTIRQGYLRQGDGCLPLNAEALTWPLLSEPHPSIIEEYERTQTSRAKPLLHTGR